MIQLLKKIKKAFREYFEEEVYRKLYHKYKEFTMIPENVFIGNLKLVRQVNGIEGGVVECGVWRGGMSAAIAEVLGKDRKYYLFDSFEGLPQAKEIDGESAIAWQKDITSPIYFDNCRAEIEYAEQAMRLSGAIDVSIHKGWFEDTLPLFNSNENIALLRLDGDWYDSTMDCLKNLYPKLGKGGILIIDDYYAWDGCCKALHDYLSQNNLPERIRESSNGVCYIIKK